MFRNKQSRFHWNMILPWIELITITIVGLFLYFPLQRKDLADLAWILGLLFTFNNLATNKMLKDEFDSTRKLGEVIDLSQKCDVEEVNRILHLYLAIREAEFRSLKDEIIQRCITQLSSLAHDKATVAGGGEYHVWLRDMLQLCSQNEQVIAISVMAESTWIEIPAEKNYLDENIKAVKRGINIERIFVSKRERLRDKRNREVIYQHMEHAKEGLIAYIVFLEELAIQDPTLLKEIGEGFVLFGDRVALIDTSVPPNEAQGTVTINPERLRRCQRLFERLKLHARIADTQLFNQLDNNAGS